MSAGRTEAAYHSEFTLLRPLAMGGMAEILLARVKGSVPEHLVVLKRLHRHLAADHEHVEMFMDEARLATTLRHSNVVEVYEAGEDSGQYYIVMEYLHGHDLRRVMQEMSVRSVSLRLSQALAIISRVCRGLDYTHERMSSSGEFLGVVHRDVSPHNVLITFNGSVKLLDFGIAKARSQTSRTRTGILKGKVAYMSPEQARGDDLDRRSDVFCVGILLWEMTTGQWLYRRKSELETLKAVVESDAPPPSQFLPAYPRELEQIVMKTLARKREDRWATAGELADAITAFADNQVLSVAPSTLGRMMTSLFSEEAAAWQDARRAGASLGDHLIAELEREERGNLAARKVAGAGPDWRGTAGEGGGGFAEGFGRQIMVEDFDSPTVDHSPEDLQASYARELGGLEDEPTTVHQSQRAAQPALALPAPRPIALGTHTARSPRPSPAPAAQPVSPRRARPTLVTRSAAPPDAPGEPRAWQMTPGRMWLTGSAVLAVLAAIWLAVTVPRRDADLPSAAPEPSAPAVAAPSTSAPSALPSASPPSTAVPQPAASAIEPPRSSGPQSAATSPPAAPRSPTPAAPATATPSPRRTSAAEATTASPSASAVVRPPTKPARSTRLPATAPAAANAKAVEPAPPPASAGDSPQATPEAAPDAAPDAAPAPVLPAPAAPPG